MVLVPFPFTDLSGRKRRPALVVSPDGFGEEDLILCAITSRVPAEPTDEEVLLEPADVVDRPLPKRSLAKVGKLFTMHQRLVAGAFGVVSEEKLEETLGKLRRLFAEAPRTENAGHAEGGPSEEDLRTDDVDESVLALLHLNAFSDKYGWRAWKTLDSDALERLHERGLIDDPKSKAKKSVALTEEGRRATEEAFRRRFAAP